MSTLSLQFPDGWFDGKAAAAEEEAEAPSAVDPKAALSVLA